MFKKRKVFIVIEFDNIHGLFDYPKDLPIPHLKEEVHFNGRFGRVKEVKHMTNDSVSEIKIRCIPLK